MTPSSVIKDSSETSKKFYPLFSDGNCADTEMSLPRKISHYDLLAATAELSALCFSMHLLLKGLVILEAAEGKLCLGVLIPVRVCATWPSTVLTRGRITAKSGKRISIIRRMK